MQYANGDEFAFYDMLVSILYHIEFIEVSVMDVSCWRKTLSIRTSDGVRRPRIY